MAGENNPFDNEETYRRLAQAQADYAEMMGRGREYQDALNKAIADGLPRHIALAQADKLLAQESALLEKAFKNATYSLQGFNSALQNTTDSFGKYESGIESLGKATQNVLNTFGTLGKVAGLVVQGLTALSGSILKQTDAIVKSYDEMAKVGGAAGLTADEIYKFGKQAGFTYHNLDKFTKAASESSDTLVAMGGSVSKGMKAFTEFADVGDETVQQYRRLGLTQEELLAAQTHYIKNQQAAGALLTKSPKELQKASLEYIDSIIKLSELTGASTKKQQEALDFAAANDQYSAYKFQKELEREEARKRGDQATVDRITNELKAKDEFIRGTANFSTKTKTALLETISSTTPVITENTAHLKVAGYNIEAIADKLRRGEGAVSDFYAENARVQKRVANQYGEGLTRYGSYSADLQKVTGTDIENRREAMKTLKAETEAGRRELAEEEKLAAAKVEQAKKEGNAGQTAIDMATRRAQIEREYNRAFESLIDALNPFTKSLQTATNILTGLGIAIAGLGVVALFKNFTRVTEGIKAVLGLGMGARGSSALNPMYVTMGAGVSPPRTPGTVPSGMPPEVKTKYETLRKQGVPAAEAKRQAEGFKSLGRAEQAIKGAPVATTVPTRAPATVPTVPTVPAKTPGAPTAMGGLGKGSEALGKFGEGNTLKSLARGLKLFANPKILLGATIFGSSVGIIITTIGAGIAAASWLMGKALPTLAEGLKSFQDLDGDKLAGAGKGIAALGGGLAVFGAGGALASFGSIASNISDGLVTFFGGKTPINQFFDFAEKAKTINVDATKKTAEAFGSFATAIVKAGIGGGFASFGNVTSNIVNGFAKLTGGDAVDKFVQFINKTKDIDPNKAEKIGEAFKKFAEGLGMLGGVRTAVPTTATTLAPSAPAAPASTTTPTAAPPTAATPAKPTAATPAKPTAATPAPTPPTTTPSTSKPTAAPAPVPKTNERMSVEELKQLRKEVEEKGPATSSAQSTMAYRNRLRAIDNQIKDLEAQKAEEAKKAKPAEPKPTATPTTTKPAETEKPKATPVSTKTEPKPEQPSAGGGRGFVNPPMAQPSTPAVEPPSAGGGRGFINPPEVTPEPAPAPEASKTAPLAAAPSAEPVKTPEPPTQSAEVSKPIAEAKTVEPSEAKPESMFSKFKNLLGFSGKGKAIEGEDFKIAKTDTGAYDPTGRGELGVELARPVAETKKETPIDNLSDILAFTGKSGSLENFLDIDPSVKTAVAKAGAEYLAATGKKFTINSSYRDPEDQKRLYQETVDAGRPGIGPTGMPVAKPGASSHEQGLAVDIQQGKDDNIAKDFLNKYGLVQNVPNDPVHFTLNNQRPDIPVAKTSEKDLTKVNSKPTESEDQIKQLIKTHEGLSLTPYQDTKGLWTVGYGHLIGKTLTDAYNKTFSKDEVDRMFDKDYDHHRDAAENIPGFSKLDKTGQGALIDLTFNMGPAWFKKWPELQKQLGAGDTQAAALNLEQSDWYKQVKSRGPTVVNMVRTAKVSAADEGIASGPMTGYPATLHGDELIKKITKNSILDKLAHTPFQEASKPISNETTELSAVLEELKNLQTKTYELLDNKLTAMVDNLEDSVDVQENIYKLTMN